jgi:hypothetical protein
MSRNDTYDRQQDGTLRARLGDILVLLFLSPSQIVVLVEQSLSVSQVSLLVGRSDHSQTTTGNVVEANVEATEFSADKHENGVRELRVVSAAQETGVEPEGQGGLVLNVEVRLDDRRVENQECAQDIVINVSDGLLDLSFQTGVDAVRSGGGRSSGLVVSFEVLVQLFDQLPVFEDGIGDTLLQKKNASVSTSNLIQQFTLTSVNTSFLIRFLSCNRRA